MANRTPARPAQHPTRSTSWIALALLGFALVGIVGCRSLVSASGSPFDILGVGRDGSVDEADGVVPDGTTVFDDDLPALANLDPDLLDALQRAATDAADDQVEVYVNSGWRSAEYQDQLLEEAIDEYGSAAEAARWVATPETSPHVSGDAVDLGPADATAWLSARGAAYGLCRIYDNEPWHYELRPEAIGQGCPPTYADASQDPRLRQ